ERRREGPARPDRPPAARVPDRRDANPRRPVQQGRHGRVPQLHRSRHHALELHPAEPLTRARQLIRPARRHNALSRCGPFPHGQLEYPRIFPGEVAEWLKAQHWKCCWRLKPPRGFESPPLRFLLNPSSPRQAHRPIAVAGQPTLHSWTKWFAEARFSFLLFGALV